MKHNVEDIAAMREQGDLKGYLLSLISQVPAAPKPAPIATPGVEPAYGIAHKGGWPIGTAATGPTPMHGRCTCPLCEQAAVVQLPTPTHQRETDAA